MTDELKKHQRLIAFAILMSLPVAATLWLSWIAGPYSWDDGAITLAFGRTLFETGEFALTAVSPRVEGSSSLLYTVLNGSLIHFLGLNFYAAIDASRIVTAVFLGATSALLFHILQKYCRPSQAFITAFLYCILPVNYCEAFNGMEMIALGFFFLLYFRLLDTRPVAALVVLPFLLLTRVEAGFYVLAVLALSSGLAARAMRRRYWMHFAFAFGLLALLEIFRFYYFGSLIPNTVLAKMHIPYSREGQDEVFRKLEGVLIFIKFYAFPALAVLGAIPLAKSNAHIRPDTFIIFAFAVFAFITGSNWGYDARMTLGLLAPALVAVAASGAIFAARFKIANALSVSFVLVALTLFTHSIGSIHSVSAFAGSVRAAIEFKKAAATNTSNTNPSAHYISGFYRITPENYKITGEAVAALADRLSLSAIIFATPDVGGLGLCCNRIAVLDIALLTNPVLAVDGYAHFDAYLSSVKPDIIETHGIWSQVSNIYSGAFFRQTYLPIVFRDNLFYLRNDHVERLLAGHAAREVPITAASLKGVRYSSKPIDADYRALVGKVVFVQ